MKSDSLPGGSRASTAPHGALIQPSVPHQPIAIVGLSCRFGGEADNASRLWELCKEGKSAWSPIPSERFDIKSSYHPDKNRSGRNHVVGGYFFDHDIASFDAGFFNLSSDVANTMDPQLRLLLESVYEATENAGIPLGNIAGTDTSVFTGCWGKDYHELQARDPDILPASFLTGNGTAMLSNRVSHFFDLQGASMSIDTGCSSGLVALHQGCRSILWGDSDVSIVAASNVMLSPDLFIALSNLGMTGADGKCYAWDSRAEGYGRGEGVTSLILKPLDAAIRDGDHIHALVRETALNQDGKTKTLTSPSVAAQIRLIEQCYKRAGLDLSETGYVEAHMTGTLIGDLTEAEALASTFGKSRAADDPVLVGSVKTNIGHIEPVSGLAAIVKTIWALKARQIPPNINYEIPNSKIPLQEWNLRVPTSLTEWPKDKLLRASINNFGYGGANAHVILEAAPETGGRATIEHCNPILRDRVYVVSANDSVSLQAMMANLAKHILTSIEDDMLGDLAYTLSDRRSRLSLTAAVQGSSRAELASRLTQWSRKLSPTMRPPRLGFVFNGQGAQWHAMGRELMNSYPVFGSAIHKADEILRSYGSTWSLRDELYQNAESTRVSEVHISQPVTVALQLCLVDLLTSWGITPAAVVSHSSGEIAAAYSAGRLSFEQALGVAYWRGELAMKNKKLKSLSGGMMAVRISPEHVLKYLTDTPSGHVVVACVNSLTSVTLSGDMVALDEVYTRLKGGGFSPKKLNVPLAYHSHHMKCIEKDYTEHLEEILLVPTQGQPASGIIFASPVTGGIVPPSEILTAEHYTRNLTNPVLFSQALEKMCFAESGSPEVDIIVEIGAHSTLAGPIRQVINGRKVFYAGSSLQNSVDAIKSMQNLACELVNRGYPVSLNPINSPVDEECSFLPDLPAYPWNHTSQYWTEPRISKEIRHKKFAPHELIGTLIPGENGLSPTWRNFLRLADIPWLIDYHVESQVVLPTAAYFTMAIKAVQLVTGLKDTPCRFQLRDIEILDALEIPDSSAGVETQLNLRSVEDGWYEFTLSSLGAGGDWFVNCNGGIFAAEEVTNGIAAASQTDHPLGFDNHDTTYDVDSLYSSLNNMGIEYGPTFRNLTSITTAGNRSVTDFDIPSFVSETHGYVIHPTTLDSILQSTYISIPTDIQKTSVVLPDSIRSISIGSSFSRYTGKKLQAHTETESLQSREYTSKVAVIIPDDNQLLPTLSITGFLARALPRSDGDQPPDQRTSISRLEWELDAWTHIPASLKDSMRITLGEREVSFEKKMMRLSYYLIYDAARELEGSSQNIQKWQPHHRNFFDWMKEIVILGEQGLLNPRSKAWSRAAKGAKQILVDDMNASDNASARLTVRVGKDLARIVRGEVAPLELMMEGNLLNQYYMDYPKLKDRTYKHLSKVVELFSVSRPGAKVLEIGGGTSGATKVVLEAFSPKAKFNTSGSLVGHYTFTDVSPGFFQSAREKLASWANWMDFRPLNIEEDLSKQSFKEESFDIIVASLVLHATKSLHTTMSNVRKLLKPGGKLLLIETTTDRIDLQLVFGTFPGWWLSKEPYRKSSPNVPLETWDKVLRETGFTGIEFDIGDCEEAEFQCTSLIVTSAIVRPSYPSAISIVQVGKMVPSYLAWFQELGEAIRQRIGVTPTFESFDDAKNWDDKVCIFAAEMDRPFVHGIKQSDFDKLRALLVESKGLLWLSCGDTVNSGQPSFSESYGLLRTIRQEDTSKRCIQLDFAPDKSGDNFSSDKINHIVDVFEQNFDFDRDFVDKDSEYAVNNSLLYVPRIYPHMEVKETSGIPPTSLKSSNATFLLVGGMGGIGRAIIMWLIERGAANILAVSRTADKHADAEKLAAVAHSSGCNLQFRSCDISIEDNLIKLLEDCSRTLPPICGVINAAMVLDATVLERMTFSQWSRVTNAKVAISLNLHLHLPNLQFFIMLSSVTGVVGHMSESNYAAGSAFQDALARHRTAHGLPAVVLDLSTVESVGWVAQNYTSQKDARKLVESLGAVPMSLDVVLELLDEAIETPLRAFPAESQVVVGLCNYAAIPDASVSKHDRRFGTLRLADTQTRDSTAELKNGSTSAKDHLSILLAAISDGSIALPALKQLIVDAITSKLAIIFNMDFADIDTEVPLASYGVDSLVAVDLRNWLSHQLRVKVSVGDITQAPSLPDFAKLIVINNGLVKNI